MDLFVIIHPIFSAQIHIIKCFVFCVPSLLTLSMAGFLSENYIFLSLLSDNKPLILTERKNNQPPSQGLLKFNHI